MTTLMLSELNERPLVRTLSALVAAISDHMFLNSERKLIIGERVAVEICLCKNAYTRHLSTRKFTESMEDVYKQLTMVQLLLCQSGVDNIARQEQVEETGRVVLTALTLWTNFDPAYGEDYCDEDEGQYRCDYHSKLIDLRNAALTIAMLEFQRAVFVSQVADVHGNRKSAQDRVAAASAEVIKVWRSYPQLRSSVDSIQPFIEIEALGSPTTTYEWSDDSQSKDAEERPRFTNQAE